jgi:hypothetical protein
MRRLRPAPKRSGLCTPSIPRELGGGFPARDRNLLAREQRDNYNRKAAQTAVRSMQANVRAPALGGIGGTGSMLRHPKFASGFFL